MLGTYSTIKQKLPNHRSSCQMNNWINSLEEWPWHPLISLKRVRGFIFLWVIGTICVSLLYNTIIEYHTVKITKRKLFGESESASIQGHQHWRVPALKGCRKEGRDGRREEGWLKGWTHLLLTNNPLLG